MDFREKTLGLFKHVVLDEEFLKFRAKFGEEREQFVGILAGERFEINQAAVFWQCLRRDSRRRAFIVAEGGNAGGFGYVVPVRGLCHRLPL